MSGHTETSTKQGATTAPQKISDQSFVRFGGLAGLLLALTSWSSVIVFYVLVPKDQQLPIGDKTAFLASLVKDPTGTELFYGLYALIAVWALIGIVGLYYRVRAAGEAWAFFATLVGAVAAVGTIANALYQVANYQFLAAGNTDAFATAIGVFQAQPPTNPFGIMTFGLTGFWFLLISLLLLKTTAPKLLALLGFVAVADLFFGFVVSLLGLNALTTYAGVIAGAVGGPIFWLWLGILLWRKAE
ncbi:MAG TPA: hypothetical protein VH540_05220 [Ktedonobacterales bacterium]|jgi:hypothetical protein